MICDPGLTRTGQQSIGSRVATDADKRLRDHVLAVLDGLPARSRAMFGGYGLYLEETFFGVIAEGRVYLRTDDESREEYTSRGMTALQPRFRPRGTHTVDRNFQVPPEVLDDVDLLREWAQRAAAARR